MDILIAFDRTLCPDPCESDPTTPPDPEAVSFLSNLHRAGHRITISSCRASGAMEGGWRWRHALRVIRDYLHLHGIPYDTITAGRPCYDLLIDDNSRQPDGSWRNLEAQLTTGALTR